MGWGVIFELVQRARFEDGRSTGRGWDGAGRKSEAGEPDSREVLRVRAVAINGGRHWEGRSYRGRGTLVEEVFFEGLEGVADCRRAARAVTPLEAFLAAELACRGLG